MPLFNNSIVKVSPRRKIEHSNDNQVPETEPISYTTLYKAFKQCPELVGTITPLVMDILSDGYKILGSSRIKKKNMEKHLININWTRKLKHFLIHAFLTGDGYLEYQKLTQKDFKNLIEKTVAKLSDETKLQKSFRNQLRSKFAKQQLVDEISEEVTSTEVLPFNLFNIKTDTFHKIVNDHGEVDQYKQDIPNLTPVFFTPDQIINWSPINLEEVYGFAPIEAALNDTATLIYSKEYAGQFFENGGHIDNLYILPKSKGINDRNYEVLKHELSEATKKKKWHKSLVITGDVKREKLNDFNKDLEFPELIKQMTMRILMAYGVPPTKTPLGEATKGVARELNENYWKIINYYQTELENLFNEKIFRDYSLTIVFNRTYKIDELREAQIIGILVDRGLISQDEARKRIGYFEPIPKEDTLVNQKPSNELPHRDLGDRQDARGLGNDTGARLASNRTMNKNELVLKTKSGMTMNVKWDDFKKIVEMTGIPFQNAKIFYEETFEEIIMYYSDTVFTYKCKVSKDSFNRDLIINAVRLVGESEVTSPTQVLDDNTPPIITEFGPIHIIDHSGGDR